MSRTRMAVAKAEDLQAERAAEEGEESTGAPSTSGEVRCWLVTPQPSAVLPTMQAWNRGAFRGLQRLLEIQDGLPCRWFAG